MLDFFSNRITNAINKAAKKNALTPENIQLTLREIRLALLEADVNLKVVKLFIANVKTSLVGIQVTPGLDVKHQIIKIVNQELMALLGTKQQSLNLSIKPSTIMLVGLQGTGKTTTVAKIVKYLTKQKKLTKIMAVACDVYRPAAIDQLVELGKQHQFEVFTLANAKPEAIALAAFQKAKTEQFDAVIFDTAGRLHLDDSLMGELVRLKKIIKPKEVLMVINAMSGQDIINVASTFNQYLDLSGLIITQLDSDARAGAALSIRQLLNIPIKFIGTGEHVKDLDVFHPDRMARRILGMGDALSLIEKASEVIDEKAAKKSLNKIISGNFNMNDLLQNLSQIKKMGKLGSILKMIPGMPKLSSEQKDRAQKTLFLAEILISSMTLKERSNPKLLKQPKRKQRILKGSGRSAQEYNALLRQYEQMKKQMEKMKSMFGNQSSKSGNFKMPDFGNFMK